MSAGVAVSLLVLRCADVERSRAFYEALGLVFRRERHGAGPAHYASTVGDGLVVELYPQGTRNTADLRFGLRLLSHIGVLERIARCGGSVLSRDSDDRVTVRDPDGHTIELELAAAPPATRVRVEHATEADVA